MTNTGRKESNQLSLYIEFIKKELNINKECFYELLNMVKEKSNSSKELAFPMIFYEDVLIDLLDDLASIKSNYFRSGNNMFESPNILYILSQKIIDTDKKIKKQKLKTYENKLLGEKSLIILAGLEKEKEELLDEFEQNSERNIYGEFETIYRGICTKTNDGKIFILEKDSFPFLAVKKIYELLEVFVKNTNKTKEDVLNIYDQIPLFSFDDKLVLGSEFEQDVFDLYYRQGLSISESKDDLLFLACEKYYRLKRLINSISNYRLKWSNVKWMKYSDELVMINNKQLYIRLNELNEYGIDLKIEWMNADIEEKEKIVKGNFRGVIDSISEINELLYKK